MDDGWMDAPQVYQGVVPPQTHHLTLTDSSVWTGLLRSLSTEALSLSFTAAVLFY